MMLLYFLSELYNTKTILDAKEICDFVYDSFNGFMKYSLIYTDPRILKILKISWVFRNLIGFNPSKTHIILFNSKIKQINPSFYECVNIIKTHFQFFSIVYNTLSQSPSNLETLQLNYKAYCNDLTNMNIVKHELHHLLKSRFRTKQKTGSSETLYKFYLSCVQPYHNNVQLFYDTERKIIEDNRLLTKCVISDVKFPNDINDIKDIELNTVVDALNYNICQNPYILRIWFNKTILVLSKDLPTHLIKYIHKHLPSTIDSVIKSSSNRGDSKTKQIVFITEDNVIDNVWYSQFAKQIRYPTNRSNIIHITDDFIKTACHLKCTTIEDIHDSIICSAVQDVLTGAMLWNKYLYQRFVTTNPINYSMKLVHENNKDTGIKNAVVMIDNRPNPLSVMSCCITGKYIMKDHWHLVIMTSEIARPYYQNIMDFYNIPVKIISDNTLLNVEKFQIQDYNNIMKDSRIWKDLVDLCYEKVLIIQDDGMLINEGVEKYLLYDYVGAPWIHNDELFNVSNHQLVGNGGLSIRDTKMHYYITKNETKASKNRLFNNNTEPIPEDVFFANAVQKALGKIPTRSVASGFSSEQIINLESIGFHKTWAYNELSKVEELLSIKI